MEAVNEERLRALVEPSTTAVLTMELQRAIVGEGALLPALADEVERTRMLDVVRRVCGAARVAGARVVHCTAVTRPDGAGAATNSRLMALADRARRERGGAATAIGTAGAALVDGLEDGRDIVVARLHGLTPFTSTSLDQILRNLGIRTVVATGVSLNIGVLGMCLTAGDLGYQVVVVRDGVAGVPTEYGQAVLDNTLSMVATIVTSGELLAAW